MIAKNDATKTHKLLKQFTRFVFFAEKQKEIKEYE